MSLTDIMVLQAIFGIAVVVLEFPSGYFADRVGYRASLVLGATLWGAGGIVYAYGATFGTIIIAEIVFGAGLAFISGADRALLWTSLETTGRTHEYTQWEGRLRAAGQTSEAVSAAAGGWLYSFAPRLPFWLQVPTAALALGTAIALREEARPQSSDHRSHLARALTIVRFTLWHHRRLRSAIALSVALGLSTFVMVWLIQPWMQTRGIPTVWFGPMWASAHVWLVGVSFVSARVVAGFGARATLLGCCLLVPLGYAGLAASVSAWGVLFYLCFMTIRGLQGPILASVMQEDAPGEDRASVLSLAALVFRLAFVVAGPLIGALVDRAGMDVAFAVLALVLTAIGLGAFSMFTRAHATAQSSEVRSSSMLALMLGAMLTLFLVGAVSAQDMSMVPVSIEGQTVRLAMRIYKAPGTDPAPALVFNHGSTGRGTDPSVFARPFDSPAVAKFFVERGFAVVMPMRRGRGGSEGTYDEGFAEDRALGYTCEPSRSIPGADRALRDIEAAMEAIRAMPFVDARRVVMGGRSRGGILSVAYAGAHPEQVRGVINFVGGWMSDRCHTASEINENLMKRGGRFPVDMLWFSGDRDPFYSVHHSRGNFAAFQAAGGKGAFHEFPPPSDGNGHRIGGYPDLWASQLDAYLKSIGLASAR